jgi:hypothetical protein
MYDMPTSSYDDDMKKRNARMAGIFKTAERKSGSRLLKEAGAQYNEKEIDKDKMSALSDLYSALCNEIRQGEMEPKEAIKDFYDGAMAIFGTNSNTVQSEETSKDGKAMMKRMVAYS